MANKSRVLRVNPVGSPGHDAPIGERIAAVKSPDTQLGVVSLITAPLRAIGFSR